MPWWTRRSGYDSLLSARQLNDSGVADDWTSGYLEHEVGLRNQKSISRELTHTILICFLPLGIFIHLVKLAGPKRCKLCR